MTEYKYYTGTSIKAVTGLVAAYSFSPQTVSNGTLIDISGNSKNLTNTNCMLSKNGMAYKTNAKSSGANVGNIKTIAMRVKLDSTTEKILEGQANDILIYSNAGTLSYTGFDNAYINSIDTDTIVAGQWIDIVITSSTNVDMDAVSLALNNVTYGNLEFADLRFYSDEKDSSWIKSYHNSFISPQLLEDFSNNPIGSTAPLGWNSRGTGDYEVKEIETAVSSPKLDVGTKFLECDSDGTTAIQSKTAYGEWEFDFNNADSSYSYIGLISPIANPSTNVAMYYALSVTASNELRMKAGSRVILLTDTNYISNDTWYRIKVARLQSEGVFKDIPTLQESDLVNLNMTSFTSNGRYGFSATSDGSGSYYAGTEDELDIVNNRKYLVEFNAKLNSGTAPTYQLGGTFGANQSNTETLIDGRNSKILTSTDDFTGVLMFRSNNSSTNYEVSGLTIRRIYDADTFAVFIKGGEFGNDYTLVDTTGGSGTNPVTDSDYTTSNYFVTDLDDGDKISGIKIYDGVEQ